MTKTTQMLNDERHERHLLRLRGIAERKQEDARRLARYDEAIRLLRECAEWSGKEDVPGLGWIDCQIDRDTIKEALAFLADEPKGDAG